MTLAEIESAAQMLSPVERQQLLLYVVKLIRSENGPLPSPRDFSSAELQQWVDEDQRDMQRLRSKSA